MLKFLHKQLALGIVLLILGWYSLQSSFAQGAGLAENFRATDTGTAWRLLETIPLQFDSHQPQGLVRAGNYFYLSSLEITVQPRSSDDTSTGAGIGHLFKFDAAGSLLAQISLGQDRIYHPGGLDFDGESIWVAVAENRPNSRSIVYRVDPATLDVEEVFRFDDHLAAVVHDGPQSALHGLSWGAEFHYSWQGREASFVAEEYSRASISGATIEYQDCQSLPPFLMLCSGIGELTIDNTHTFTVGGIELVNLGSNRVEHRITVTETAATGEFMVRRASHFEFQDAGISKFYFVPEDRQSNLYIYETR